ncbi:hypothetical protein Zmor_000350 [Zophobas morio]|uniref:Uncharacterized protein n=1 Tax=Zophobas morio TaxID=2755281 RepID=A0AA38MR81_9CUCU|nr:hypothetical protein Zmor_000350 [Zophobas morio]
MRGRRTILRTRFPEDRKSSTLARKSVALILRTHQQWRFKDAVVPPSCYDYYGLLIKAASQLAFIIADRGYDTPCAFFAQTRLRITINQSVGPATSNRFPIKSDFLTTRIYVRLFGNGSHSARGTIGYAVINMVTLTSRRKH